MKAYISSFNPIIERLFYSCFSDSKVKVLFSNYSLFSIIIESEFSKENLIVLGNYADGYKL